MIAHHYRGLFYSVLLAVLVGAGVVVFFDVSQIALMFTVFLFGVSVVHMARYQEKRRLALYTLIIGGAVCIGLFRAWLVVEAYTPFYERVAVVSHDAIVTQEPQVRASYIQFRIHDTNLDVLIDVRVRNEVLIRVGDSIQYSGVIEPVDSFTTEYGRTFAYHEFLFARGVAGVMYDPTFEKVSVVSWWGGVRQLLGDLRSRSLKVLDRALPPKEAGFASAMLLGAKESLSDTVGDTFRHTGLVHIVVLSGMHIMMVFGVLLYLASFMFGYRIRYGVAFFGTVLFGIMVGLTPTILRALIMTSGVALAFALGRGSASLRMLALAAMLLVLYNPYMLIYDPGFQFSFLASFAMIVVVPLFLQVFRKLPNLFHFRDILSATVGINVILLPCIAYSIGSVPVLGIGSNVLVLPFVPLALLSSAVLVAIELGGFPFVKFFEVITYILHTTIIYIAEIFDRVPLSHIVFPEFSFILLLVVYGIIGFFLYRLWYVRGGLPETQISSEKIVPEGWIIEDVSVIRARRAT